MAKCPEITIFHNCLLPESENGSYCNSIPWQSTLQGLKEKQAQQSAIPDCHGLWSSFRCPYVVQHHEPFFPHSLPAKCSGLKQPQHFFNKIFNISFIPTGSWEPFAYCDKHQMTEVNFQPQVRKEIRGQDLYSS